MVPLGSLDHLGSIPHHREPSLDTEIHATNMNQTKFRIVLDLDTRFSALIIVISCFDFDWWSA